MRQLAEPQGLLDVTLDVRGIRRLVFARGAKAYQAHPRTRKTLTHFGAASLGNRGLHPVAMRSAKLDALETRVLAIVDDRFNVPVLSELVCHHAQLQWRRRFGW